MNSANEISFDAVLWTHKDVRATAAGDEYPVKIRVTYRRKRKYFQVQYNGKSLYLTERTFDEITSTTDNKFRGVKRDMRRAIDDKKDALKEKADRIKPFSLDKLSERNTGFLAVFRDYCDQMQGKGKIGSHRAYMSAYRAFYAFRSGHEIEAADITVDTLKDFEAYLLQPHSWGKDKDGNPKPKRKINKTSVGIYMRSLKVIYNQCIQINSDLAHLYPFRKHQNERGKYAIKKGSGHKGIALLPDQIRAFMATPIEKDLSDPMYVAKRTWEFLFRCQGMNVVDFARLEYSNLKPDRIEYIRRKTRDTEVEEKPIVVPLTPEIQAIIDEMGRPQKSGYVFDILHQRMTPEIEDKAIQACTKQLNKYLKKLCEQCDLPTITSYSSRHSYASLMKWSGAPEALISEALGHADVKTTQHYLSRFDVTVQRDANATALMMLQQESDSTDEPEKKSA